MPQRKIKIIAVPPGQAPLEIREKWVGLVLPIAENVPKIGVETGIFGGEPENTGGYKVKTEAAISELEIYSPNAAAWWRQYVDLRRMPWLVFKREVCEEIK